MLCFSCPPKLYVAMVNIDQGFYNINRTEQKLPILYDFFSGNKRMYINQSLFLSNKTKKSSFKFIHIL